MEPRTRKVLLRSGLVVVSLLLLAVLGFVWWALTPLGPSEEALEALKTDELVRVEEQPEGIVFTSTDGTSTVGFVFYPGGRVDVRSYAPLAREIAERGYLVVLVPMRLNLAVLSPNRADSAIEAHPEIVSWVVGGHSLGGAMAARYAADNIEHIDGLILLGAYPPNGSDLSQSGIAVTSVVGTRDGVLDQDTFLEASRLLPANTAYVSIEGGNHAQFGSYGDQPGDMSASIMPDDQRWDTVIAITETMLPLRIKAQ
ncbi:MAG: alpha/beta hydrolase [Coriobacteriia bacterium]|nr:alpha/beta hydrolase [Coriobacteriia bacterium]